MRGATRREFEAVKPTARSANPGVRGALRRELGRATLSR